jgi:hypothetical protein
LLGVLAATVLSERGLRLPLVAVAATAVAVGGRTGQITAGVGVVAGIRAWAAVVVEAEVAAA